jgi:hypothetical protein
VLQTAHAASSASSTNAPVKAVLMSNLATPRLRAVEAGHFIWQERESTPDALLPGGSPPVAGSSNRQLFAEYLRGAKSPGCG